MYMLFGGTECYYASGGASDLIKCSEDTKELHQTLKVFVDYNGSGSKCPLDWWHIYNTDSNSIIERSNTKPYGYDDSNEDADMIVTEMVYGKA